MANNWFILCVMSKEIDIDTNLEPAILFFRSQANLAHAMKLDPQAVTQWKRRGIPPARAKQISELTGGVVKPWDIKPKFFSGFDAL